MRKIVFLTGAGSGLGKEAAIELARRGHKVIATTQYEVQAEELNRLAKEENLPIESFLLDIRKEEDRKKVEGYSFDVFIANAAIGESGSVCEIPIEKIEEVFETNVFSNIQLVQIVIAQMMKQKREGRIIFLSSLVGRIPMPFLSPYCASKAAIETFAMCLKEEMKLIPDCNIEIGMIEPGAYATGFNKENNEKMYEWMTKDSYFYPHIDTIKKYQIKIWDLIEIKPFDSVIKQYVKAVEDKKLNFRYCTPWYQAVPIQIGRMIGL